MTNNTPYSQFRNVAERKISMLKKIMKQVLFGLPGPQRVCVERDILAATMLRASSAVNNIPYIWSWGRIPGTSLLQTSSLPGGLTNLEYDPYQRAIWAHSRMPEGGYRSYRRG